jgi:hypothetical protein
MDYLFALAGLGFFGYWIARFVLKMWRLNRSRHWPTTEATIQSAEIEVVNSGKYIKSKLPCFAFTYSVNEETFSGRFSLEAWGEQAERSLKELLDRKLTVQYDPRKPEFWHIPSEVFAGFPLHQKLELWAGKLYPDD